jgi:hypothetical protein
MVVDAFAAFLWYYENEYFQAYRNIGELGWWRFLVYRNTLPTHKIGIYKSGSWAN